MYDFEPVQSQLTFVKDSDSKVCKTIQIVNDNFKEEEQEFGVRLERVTAYPNLHLNLTFASILISDDDGEALHKNMYNKYCYKKLC